MRKNYLHAPNGNAGPIQYLDSIDAYQNAFLATHEEKRSWRKVGDPYKIHPSMARMIANGHDPGNRIREKLRLPDKEKVEVCRSCGVAHTTKRCTSTNHRPRPPRISIRLDNPESAARSIRGSMVGELIRELVKLLNTEIKNDK